MSFVQTFGDKYLNSKYSFSASVFSSILVRKTSVFVLAYAIYIHRRNDAMPQNSKANYTSLLLGTS